MDTNYWLGQGVLGVMLMTLMIGLWRIVVWAKATVVEPVVKSHLELVDTLKQHAPKQSDAMDKQTDSMTRQEAQLAKQTLLMEEQQKTLDELVKVSKEEAKNIKEIAKKGGNGGTHP